MNVTVEIPDEIAKRLPAKDTISREMLEAYAAEAYRTERLSRHQVGVLLGMDRWQTEDFLAKRVHLQKRITNLNFDLSDDTDRR